MSKDDPVAQGVSERIRALMNSKKMTQRSLSTISGISYHTVHRYCNRQSLPRRLHIERLANALGVTPEYILYGDLSRYEGIKQNLAYSLPGMTYQQKKELLNLILDSIVEKSKEKGENDYVKTTGF